MSWVAAAMGGAALLGAVNASQQRKAQERQNQQSADIAAAQQQYSPWTGMKPASPEMKAVTASPLQGAMQGALTGAMYGNAIKKAQGNSLEKEFDQMPSSQSRPSSGSSPWEMGGGMAGGPMDSEMMRKKMLGMA